jgi:hypothetical protein
MPVISSELMSIIAPLKMLVAGLQLQAEC